MGRAGFPKAHSIQPTGFARMDEILKAVQQSEFSFAQSASEVPFYVVSGPVANASAGARKGTDSRARGGSS